jgi:hypothetical protein
VAFLRLARKCVFFLSLDEFFSVRIAVKHLSTLSITGDASKSSLRAKLRRWEAQPISGTLYALSDPFL